MKDSSGHDPDKGEIDCSSHQEFYDYYAKESESENTLKRFYSIRDLVFSILPDAKTSSLEVADIGCGAGTQSLIWARLGHKVSGIDVNEPLIHLARDRAEKHGFDVEFQVGSAENLPCAGVAGTCAALGGLPRSVRQDTTPWWGIIFVNQQ